MIMSTYDEKVDRIKSSWEKELETVISEDLWTEALKRVSNSTPCARLGLI